MRALILILALVAGGCFGAADVLHSQASHIHRPYEYTYASAAARTGATGFSSLDLGKLALQSDTNELWMLTATAPTWVLIGTLNASNLSSGTLPDARFPATLPAASGVNLTALNASNFGSGTALVARGGIGVGTLASNGVLYGNGTSAVLALAVNATGTTKFLTQSSSGAPAWGTIASGDVPTLNQNTTGTAAIATTITVSDNTTTNATYWPMYAANTTGNVALLGSSSKYYYNPGTGTLDATTFHGALSGTAATATALGTSGTTTTVLHGNAAGAPTYGSIVNADVSASAAIAGTKISPDFGSQTVVTTNAVYGDLGVFTLGTGVTVRNNTSNGVVKISEGASHQGIISALDHTGLETLNYDSETATLTVGNATHTLGSIVLGGNTSGTCTLKTAAIAGTGTVFKVPATNGTNKYVLQTDGSGATSWVQADLTAAVTGALPVPNGGTGLASGTSGGIPYFSGTTAMASSAALAANALVIGGGAGATPSTTTTGSGVLTALGNTAGGSGGFATVGNNGTFLLSAGGAGPTTTAGCTGPTQVETATNKINYWKMAFATATKSHCFWNCNMPSDYNGGTITYVVTWEVIGSASTNSVVWGLAGFCPADNGTLDTALGTSVEVTDANNGTTKLNIAATSGAVTLSGTPAAGCPVFFDFYRLGSGSDNHGSTCNMVSVRVIYTKNN